MAGRVLGHVSGFGASRWLPPMTSHAQNFEDVVLRRALFDIEAGFWIDIGAYDPVQDSVTLHFSRNGWTGINVEPNPHYLEKLRAARPNDLNLGVAVGRTSERTILHVIGDSGLTTIKQDVAQSASLPTTATVETEVVSLAQLFDEHAGGRTVDFLKVDAEGAEADIVGGGDFARHRPRIILLESTGAESYEPVLLAADYDCAWFDGLNRWYVRREDAFRAELVAQPPNLFDSIRLPAHRTGD